MSTRNIRFPKEKSLKLLRGNIITRDVISANCADEKIVMKDVGYPIASRIFKHTDIDVETLNGWKFIKNNDVKALEDAYSDDEVQEYGIRVADVVTFVANPNGVNPTMITSSENTEDLVKELAIEENVEVESDESLAYNPNPIVEETVNEEEKENENSEEEMIPEEESVEEENTSVEESDDESEEFDEEEESSDTTEEEEDAPAQQQNNQNHYNQNNGNNGRVANHYSPNVKHKKRH